MPGTVEARTGGEEETLPANAGVHVARLRLDVCLSDRTWFVANDLDGWRSVSDTFKAADVSLVALDVIGGFERGLLQILQIDGLSVARVGMRQALDFARSRAALREIVRVDSRVLRDFADAFMSFGPGVRAYLPNVDSARRFRAVSGLRTPCDAHRMDT